MYVYNSMFHENCMRKLAATYIGVSFMARARHFFPLRNPKLRKTESGGGTRRF